MFFPISTSILSLTTIIFHSFIASPFTPSDYRRSLTQRQLLSQERKSVAVTALNMTPPISTYVAGTAAICAMFTAIQFRRRIDKLEEELKHKNIKELNLDVSKINEETMKSDDSNQIRNQNEISCVPVGTIESVYRLCVGTPRQGMLAPSSRGRVKLDPRRIRPDSLDALDQYSHLWIVFVFHLNTNTNIVKKAAASGNNTFPSKVSPPALGGKRVGVFATRTPHRPNPIGFSLCKIERIDQKNFCVHISGLDLVDGTPVLDIKPYVPHYDSVGFNVDFFPESLKIPEWVASGLDRRRHVEITPFAEEELENLVRSGKLDFYGGKKNKNDTLESARNNIKSCIIEVIAADVRSSYQTKKVRKGKSQAERALKNEMSNESMNKIQSPMCTQQLDNLLIHFTVEDSTLNGSGQYVPGINSGCDDRVIIHKIEEFEK